jgi:ring-1,2-phenylacetyl-CoA epoxidase subunit PaaC
MKNLLLKMADDALIIGHRNSEWTGIGPVLEEDIAFSSMSQDKIGHAWALYRILNEELGGGDPDMVAFNRAAKDFTCCHLVEYPAGEYDFSLVRHFLMDKAEYHRYNLLLQSSFLPLANLAKKVKGELKYHVMHAETWMRQLANGSEESKARMQTALNIAYPIAFSLFEKQEDEAQIIAEKVFVGEDALLSIWQEDVHKAIESYGLKVPINFDSTPFMGGRKGYHTEYLEPLLKEMTEVFSLDPNAEW